MPIAIPQITIRQLTGTTNNPDTATAANTYFVKSNQTEAAFWRLARFT